MPSYDPDPFQYLRKRALARGTVGGSPSPAPTPTPTPTPTASYLPTLSSAPLDVYSSNAIQPGYVGPVMQLTRADGTGSPLDIYALSDGKPDLSGVAAWAGAGYPKAFFYGQVTGTLLTNTNPPRLALGNTQYGFNAPTFLTVNDALTIPTSIAVTRNAATIAMAVSSSGGTTLGGLGNSGTSTNNLSIIDQNGTLANLGNSFGSSSLGRSVDPEVVILNSGGAATMRSGDRRVSIGAQSSVALTGGRIGQAGGASFGNAAFSDVYAFVVYGVALSSADEITLAASLKSIFSVPSYTDQFRALGDSITYGQGSGSGRGVPIRLSPNLSRRVYISNGAISGTTLSGITRADYDATAFPGKQIVLNGMGANDINGSTTGANFFTAMLNWITARKLSRIQASDWIPVIATITPWTSWAQGSAKDNERLAYNQLLRDNASIWGYTVLDYANLANQGTYASVANGAYYADGTHPTDAGYVLREAYARPIFNALLDAPRLGLATFPTTALVPGVPSSGSITGATAGSTLSFINAPTGLTINSAARTWAWDGSSSPDVATVYLNEFLAGSADVARNLPTIVDKTPGFFFGENFNGTNGQSITASAYRTGGGPYVTITGSSPATTPLIQNGRVFFTDAANKYRADVTPPSANYYVEADLTFLSDLTTDDVGIICRASASANTYYTARFNAATSTFRLTKVVNGGTVTLGTPYTDAFTSGTRKFRLTCNGSTISLGVDAGDGVIVERTSATDAGITGAGYVGFSGLGIQTSTTGRHLDNFRAVAL